MKNSKLLLTSLLAAASALSVPAFGAGSTDTILINFTGGRSGNGAVSVTDDTVNGTWNNEADASQSTAQTLVFSDGTNSSATITWSSENTYTTGLTETDKVLTGYLDDGGNHAQINICDLSYLVCDITIYVSTDSDNVKFSALTINGTEYTSDESGNASEGNAKWGTSKQSTITSGTNAITLSNSLGDISIVGGANADGG